jgi:hypothetical protein
MSRKPGYLANVLAVPPLVFRFQFNPSQVTETRAYRYQGVKSGAWKLPDKPSLAGLDSLLDTLKGYGPSLTGSDGLEPEKGTPRQVKLEFQLDATVPGVDDGDDHYSGSITPDLALLRSFINPGYEPTKLVPAVLTGKLPAPCGPPPCTFIYAGLAMDCVMSDLSIRHTAFQDDGSPMRAEVSCTLDEQSYALGAIGDAVVRTAMVVRSNFRSGIGMDYLRTTPGVGTIARMFI